MDSRLHILTTVVHSKENVAGLRIATGLVGYFAYGFVPCLFAARQFRVHACKIYVFTTGQLVWLLI
jgi:hypothetical protein